MELNATLVTALVSLVIPVLTGLVTKASASATLKQVVTMTLAAANALIVSNVVDGGGAVLDQATLVNALVSWAIAVTSYLGIYKPHDANDHLAPNAGIG